MEIVLGVIALIALVIVIGKIKGPPSPKDMSDEAIFARMQSENAWIKRYQGLPFEHRQGEGLKRQHDEKQRYITELMLELTNRHSDKSQQSLAPVVQRTFELVRQGMPEEKAKEQALAEFIAARDAKNGEPAT